LGAKRRGWRALIAGIFVVLLAGAIWLWIDRIFAGNRTALADTSTARLLGRLNVMFALVVIAGVLGVVNGWLMSRSGKGKAVLVYALVVAFVSAFFIAIF